MKKRLTFSLICGSKRGGSSSVEQIERKNEGKQGGVEKKAARDQSEWKERK